MRKQFFAEIQPDDNEAGTLWEVTCVAFVDTYLIMEGLTQAQAENLARILNTVEAIAHE